MWRVYGKREEFPDELEMWDFDTEDEAKVFVSKEDKRYTEKTYAKLSRKEIELAIQNLMADMDKATGVVGVGSSGEFIYGQVGTYGADSEAQEIWFEYMHRYTTALNNTVGE